MYKLINKYRKWLMVVFGVILMVAFILPQANHFGFDPMKRKVASIEGRKVTALDMDKARREYDTFRSILEPLGLPTNPNLAKELFGAEDATHWLLLTSAARAGGFFATAADGAQFEREIRDTVVLPLVARGKASQRYGPSLMNSQFGNQLVSMVLNEPETRKELDETTDRLMPALLNTAMRGGRMTPDDLNLAFAHAMSVGRMQAAWRQAARVSDRRVALEAASAGDIVYVDHLGISARSLAPLASDPPADLVERLFRENKDKAPGEGAHGFGYRLEPRVKIEWMTVDKAAISASVEVDPVAANRLWRENRATYPGEFAAERSRIEDLLREERTTQILDAVDKAFRAESQRLIGRVSVRGGYRVLPEDWATRQPRLEQIAQLIVTDVEQTAKAKIALPAVIIRDSEHLTRSQLAALPGVGGATVRQGADSVPFADLIMRVRELSPDEQDLILQTGVPFLDGFAADVQGNRYYFQILDTRPAEPPASLDLVRDSVVADARALTQYEQLKAQAELIRSLAATEGFEGVQSFLTEAYKGVSIPPVQRNIELAKNAVNLNDRSFDVPAYRDAVLAAAARFDVMKPIDQADKPDRTLVIPLDEPLNLAIVQLVGRSPMSVERMRVEGDFFLSRLQSTQLDTDAFNAAFNKRSLSQRLNFIDLFPDTSAPADSAPNSTVTPAATPTPTPTSTPATTSAPAPASGS